MLNILIYVIIILSVPPLLLNIIHKDFLNIFERFSDVKMKNGIFGQIQIQKETQNGHTFYTTTVLFLWKLVQYTIKRLNWSVPK